jgi:hypothetical protein
MSDAFASPFRPRPAAGAASREPARRRDLCVAGPLEGRYGGALPTPLRIHDLSVRGCLIECYYDIPSGQRIALQIELPAEGWITVDAEALFLRNNVGVAVRFVGLNGANRARIERTLERLQSRSG